MSKHNKYQSSVENSLGARKQALEMEKRKLDKKEREVVTEFEQLSLEYSAFRPLFETVIPIVDEMADALDLTRRKVTPPSIGLARSILLSLHENSMNYAIAADNVMPEIVWWDFNCRYGGRAKFKSNIGKPSLTFRFAIEKEEKMFGGKYNALKIKWASPDRLIAFRETINLEKVSSTRELERSVVSALEQLFESTKKYLIKGDYLG